MASQDTSKVTEDTSKITQVMSMATQDSSKATKEEENASKATQTVVQPPEEEDVAPAPAAPTQPEDVVSLGQQQPSLACPWDWDWDWFSQRYFKFFQNSNMLPIPGRSAPVASEGLASALATALAAIGPIPGADEIQMTDVADESDLSEASNQTSEVSNVTEEIERVMAEGAEQKSNMEHTGETHVKEGTDAAPARPDPIKAARKAGRALASAARSFGNWSSASTRESSSSIMASVCPDFSAMPIRARAYTPPRYWRSVSKTESWLLFSDAITGFQGIN